jgi:hypothetical protein
LGSSFNRSNSFQSLTLLFDLFWHAAAALVSNRAELPGLDAHRRGRGGERLEA